MHDLPNDVIRSAGGDTLGRTHRVPVSGLAASSANAFATPF